MKNSILVVDDNVLFRKRIVSIIESDSQLKVVGEVEDGSLVLKEAIRLKPDLILMDISMPGMNGLDTTQQLSGIIPKVKIVILSVYDVAEYQKAAFERGACGYVIKKNMINELLPAVKAAIQERD
ncbi:response regulator transcription factor [candidate division KSB1 bacterium]|nr:response regulator transcription factor [candidate division KSB1 bacterium]